LANSFRVVRQEIENRGGTADTVVKLRRFELSPMSLEKAQRMVKIVYEVTEDVMKVPDPRAKAAATKLRRQMEEYAREGDIDSMYRYYQNAMRSAKGKLVYDRATIHNRKTLESEADRFEEIYRS